YFDKDGSVRDAAFNYLGKVQGLQIYDIEGARIGYINNDGTVRDGESNALGKIDKSGEVTDMEGNVLGYAENINYGWIACYFFFNFFK
ncbi:MAG: DUF3659 domain-containing protein, partial [Muribaculaceae bacterium]|nr:DUF3659 domain-containing protein [Muribaculaceae bacterium]